MSSDSVAPSLDEIPVTHRNAVIGIAAESHVPLEQVADAYRRELVDLERDARIKQFLPVIASRRVRHRLRRKGSASQPR